MSQSATLYAALRTQSYTLTDVDRQIIATISNAQHASSGARGTRGAGSNIDFRLKGVTGELVVARMLGIEPQVRDTGGPDLAPDIAIGNTVIEVKNGLPMEGKSKLRPDALYVVVSDFDTPGTFKVTAVRYGHEIQMDDLRPPFWACPRPGTQALNYWITREERV
jgi:hypothetical protein